MNIFMGNNATVDEPYVMANIMAVLIYQYGFIENAGHRSQGAPNRLQGSKLARVLSCHDEWEIVPAWRAAVEKFVTSLTAGLSPPSELCDIVGRSVSSLWPLHMTNGSVVLRSVLLAYLLCQPDGAMQ